MPNLPVELIEGARTIAGQQPHIFTWFEGDPPGEKPSAQLVLDDGLQFGQWLYAVAVPFATVRDGTTMAEVRTGWEQGNTDLGRLILEADTAETFTTLWGQPSAMTQVVNKGDLIEALWAAQPSWTILPFQRLSPELKVLDLDGLSPIDPGFDTALYPLKIGIGLTGDEAAVNQLRAVWDGGLVNYEPDRITRVAMTGVTALGRATAYQMEIGGITTPGQVVGPVMQAADIAHVSHEVAFAPDCPYPNPIGDPIFCARDSYLALIESIGTDVVELTGNHVNDWGPENLVHTIELYEAAGMKIFGGGRDITQARQPAIFEHNGNKIAFVGCNPVGPAFAWATATSAGSNPCDYPAFREQIRSLRDQGYLVIATLQYSEFYHYEATGQQAADFGALVDAGAAAVSGSQGHHAQGFGFRNGSFIHYGLGNLFFDQMDMLGTRQSFVDTYIIYDGRLLSVDLFTALIENYCCPRAMTAAERTQTLEAVFRASGW